MKKLHLVILICLIGCSIVGFSQPAPSTTAWDNIETAIRLKKNLTTTLARVQKLKLAAMNDRDYYSLARCFHYQLQITDLKTEDSFYFRNSAFIDSILLSPAAPPLLRKLMHVMQAQRLMHSIYRHYKFDKTLYEILRGRYNYAAMTKEQLDSIIQYHFNAARAIPVSGEVAPGNITWLSSDPLVFLFKPGLEDIIFFEQIYYASASRRGGGFYPKTAGYLLSLKPDDFIALLNTAVVDKKENSISRLYAQWMQWHKHDPAAYYFIETIARKYVYSIAGSAQDSAGLYEAYLRERSETPFDEVKAHAVYQLCLRFNEQYSANNVERDEERYNGISAARDTADYLAGVKALALYEKHRALFKKFSFLADILDRVEERILGKELQCTIEDNVLPGTPLLAKLQYKNVHQIYYRLVSLSAEDNVPGKRQNALALLFSKPAVRESVETLPLPADYNKHRTFLKLDPLPAGRYALLFGASPVTASDSTLNYLELQVSSLAAVHTGSRIYVLNRKTGMPVAGAFATGYYKRSTAKGTSFKRIWVSVRYTTGVAGYIKLPKKEDYQFLICYDNDTLRFGADNDREGASREVFDADGFDNKLAFYEDRLRMSIFTDRAIYRPGQKVHYKAILLTRKAATGATMVFSKENLKEGFSRDNLEQWMRKEKPFLYIVDPFDRKVDSIRITPNAYGTVSGTFTLPATAATGGWDFQARDISIRSENRGQFEVEEYKRPTYELAVDNPTRTWHPGEPVTFVVHARSFSGVPLAGTKITYSVSRTGGAKNLNELFSKEYLVEGAALTDGTGRLEITVTDTILQKAVLPDSLAWNFRYSLHAEAVDATGESHEISNGVNVSTRPVNIDLRMRSIYKIDELRPVVVTTHDVNGLNLGKKLRAIVYKLSAPGSGYSRIESHFADQWLYPAEQWQQWFPDVCFINDTTVIKETSVYETTINTATFEKLRLPPEKLATGNYKLVVTCEENGHLMGETERKFTIFDTQTDELPPGNADFYHLPANSLSPGDTLHFFSGNRFDSSFTLFQLKYYSVTKKHLQVISFCQPQQRRAGMKEWYWKIPADATQEVLLSCFCIKNNRRYYHTERIEVYAYRKTPQIIVQQFRNQLAPGASTTFSVTVKTRDIHIAAELMSTMYDASLDKLEPHTWRPPYMDGFERLENDFPHDLKKPVTAASNFSVRVDDIINWSPIWWSKGLAGAGITVRIQGQNSMGDYESQPLLLLEGRVPGLTITQANGLEEAMLGFATITRRLSTGNITRTYGSGVSFQALSNLVGKDKPLVILDGVPFTGDLASMKISEITEAVILRDADATAIYGSRAAQGVLLISTKGPIVLPAQRQEPIIRVRKDFNELAFFFPAVYADRDGYYRFTFTMPESVTSWKWKLLAHTKMAQFAYAERNISTVLPLMVQPNVPRLLYQGDKIMLQTRIGSLDTAVLSGTAHCKIEDVVTGEDITASLVLKSQADFMVRGNSSTSVGFEFRVPAGMLHPLRLTISAQTAGFADAEEHIIPVLSTRLLVQQSVPFYLHGADTLITAPALPVGATAYGTGLSITPKPQSTMLYALPSLANYPHDCSEQLCNKLLAYSMAIKLLRTDTVLQAAFKQARTAVPPTNDVPILLPGQPAEQAMPWLNLSNKNTREQQALTELLDTSKTRALMEGCWDKLYALQKKDGGMAWFEGGKSNERMSVYVLTSLGKLGQQAGFTGSERQMARYTSFIRDLVRYCDLYCNTTLNYFYARSFWRNQFPLRDSLSTKIKDLIARDWQKADEWSIGAQALLINTTFQYFPAGDSLQQKAKAQLSSIQQSAIIDAVNGVRWKNMADAGDLDNTSEETLALLAEAFGHAGTGDSIMAGIIKWLLTSKNEHEWSTTRGAAAAIGLLAKSQASVYGTAQTLSAGINGETGTVTNDLLQGFSFYFQQATDASSVRLRKPSADPVGGSLSYYYFTPPESLPDAIGGITLHKELFRYNKILATWMPLNKDTILHLGDTVQVELAIVTPKSLRFVSVEAKRAAAFELEDNTSGYGYLGGYYKSVRDDGTKFFMDMVAAGKTTISYKVVVAQEGTFTEGPASLNCVYKPSVSAYSRVMTIKTGR